MKNTYFLLILVLITISSCKKKTISEKSFEIVKSDVMYGGMIVSAIPFQIEGDNGKRYIREKGGVGGINISNPELDKLYNVDNIVTDSTNAILIIDFPIKKRIGYIIKNENGFRKRDIVLELKKTYSELYSEKDAFGICCHELSDLELIGIVKFNVDNKIYLEANIESKK
ncbi:hypothetical protein H8K90_11645 [Winogradskyella echinorum]|uniref:Uncharacterized protein n=1 Tax=Winogradskyella echinorum TaxID=538189 RepID=A0ABR6Y2S7_9FLAO|nr:hypothetical protein [Winogradskyella echinorum]MBC3847037.1 hypothetical protein [Winogradskyella echinorum]MBC5751385.1 hypothetical protein [Winogradskyella echinorum]